MKFMATVSVGPVYPSILMPEWWKWCQYKRAGPNSPTSLMEMEMGPFVFKSSSSIVPRKELMQRITSIGWAFIGIFSSTTSNALGIVRDAAILRVNSSSSLSVGSF